MTKIKEKEPDARVAPGNPVTFTSPPSSVSDESWMMVEAEVDAVPADEVVIPRVDVQAAAEIVFAVCDDVRGDVALYQRIRAIASTGEFDPKAFSKLQRYASAGWYARHRQLQAEAGQSTVSVPDEVIRRATEVFNRMHRLASYHLADDASASQIIEAMNNSPGHRKLANHLLGLADLYARNAKVVSADSRNYRASDERDARKLAAEIIKSVSDGSTPDFELWTGRCMRVWTLIWRSYSEVKSLGRWLLRATPDLANQRFPSLVTESRSAAQPRKVTEKVIDVTPAGGPTPVTPLSATAPRTRRRRPR